jgi:UDP-GlcNAc3NAcA epimerase
MQKILTIVGARPQFVKAAAMSKAFSDSEEFDESIVHTGQHYDKNMSEVFFNQLSIPKPQYVFDSSQSTGATFIGETISKISQVIIIEKPDGVLVYGDTNSTLAGAIAANSCGIRLIHIEAGLRSYNRQMPEEHNRVITDHLSDALFCPSTASIANLAKENIFSDDNRVVKNVGDIMFDAMKLFSQFAVPQESMDLPSKFILATIHRPVNTDDKKNLQSIVSELNILAETHDVVFPIHPRTAKRLHEFNLTLNPKVNLLPPVSYITMLYLLRECIAVVTDSGGLQKEAYFNNKLCYVVRDETEWQELVDGNQSILVGNGGYMLSKLISQSLNQHHNINEFPYGEGRTAESILLALSNQYAVWAC